MLFIELNPVFCREKDGEEENACCNTGPEKRVVNNSATTSIHFHEQDS